MTKEEILIIGAGPAGLTAAMELAKEKKKFTVIEKDNQVGGLAKTYVFKEGDLIFRTDNGPHRFYSKNPALYDFVEGLLQEKWLEVRRQTRQYIGGKFYDWPIKPAQALFNVGYKTAAKMIAHYCLARVQYKIFRKEIKNFEDYIIANFGRSLGNFNIINYTEKIWGVPASTIHTDWAAQRIRGLSVGFLVKAAIEETLGFFKTYPPRTLVDVFYYPEYGTGLTYQMIKDRLEDKGYQFLFNTEPMEIHHQDNKITEVLIRRAEQSFRIKPEYLIESVPLRDFLKLLKPAPPTEVLAAATKMKYRDQVYLFITLNRDRATDDQWIYFPEKHIPFGRISEMKNFSQKMSPPGKTSLFVEYFCFEGDEIWNKSKEQLLELTMEHLEVLGFCRRDEMRHCYLIKQKRVYPIYDLNYKDYLGMVKDYLNQFENLFYIGRPGRFRYNNQDHSLEMGFLAARSIIEGKIHNLDLVGAETEYFEKGQWR